MDNFEEEKKKLHLEISNLQKSILWYQRNYEDKNWFEILCDKFFGYRVSDFLKQRFFIKKIYSIARINRTKNNSTISKKILCSIVNHNHNENALNLYELFINYFDSVILDSGSIDAPKNSLKYDNIYYSGLLNEAYFLAKKYKYQYLFFICSDVKVQKNAAEKMNERLLNLNFSKIGVYSPSSIGESHFFCKKKTSDELREVPFVEGFIFICDVKILDQFCPVNTKENLYGWGLDIAKSFFSKKSNKISVIDDNVEVEHMKGTGYSKEIAEYEMLAWAKTLGNNEFVSFFEKQVDYIKKSVND